MIDNILNSYKPIFHFSSKWDIKGVVCCVMYYESHPLDNLSQVFLSILIDKGGLIKYTELATMLGFNILSDFSGEINRYKDDGEIEIFESFVKSVYEWGLIDYSTRQNSIEITDLGRVVMQTGVKYKFFTAHKDLPYSRSLSDPLNTDSLFYPFGVELGVYTELVDKRQIAYDALTIDKWYGIEKKDLIKRLELSSNDAIVSYFDAYKTNKLSLSSVDIDIDLYDVDGVYIPIVVKDGHICRKLTELILANDNVRDRKIEEGLYKKLLSDPCAILDYNTIIPFADLLDVDTLVKDSRLNWDDSKLFSYIADLANGDSWYNISECASIESIVKHIDKYRDKLSWVSISRRLDVDFIVQHPTTYPWSFEIVVDREEVGIDIIKQFLILPELHEEKWNCAKIMPKLDLKFIVDNINDVNFNLIQATKDYETELMQAIVSYPDKLWDWGYISSSYNLSFLCDNIELISTYINSQVVVDRFLTDCNWAKLISEHHNTFASILTSENLFNVNCKDYIWTPRLIDIFETYGYLIWASSRYQLGFECNPYFQWSQKAFALYSGKITTAEGYTHVSSNITDYQIIIDNLQFNWDWSAISRNRQLMNDSKFVYEVFDKIDIESFVDCAEWATIESVCSTQSNLELIKTSSRATTIFTCKASFEFVKSNFKFQWDWHVLTCKFIKTIKMESLDLSRWADKWDWSYLSLNLDINNVIAYLDTYAYHWDWSILSSRLPIDILKVNLLKFNNYWDWNILMNNKLTKEDLYKIKDISLVAKCLNTLDNEVKTKAWKDLTCKYDYSDLELIISLTMSNAELQHLYFWDYSYFYALEEFNLLEYLNNYSAYVSWDDLSECNKLKEELKYDKTITSFNTWKNYTIKEILDVKDYHWNFAKLSRIYSLTMTPWIITDSRLKLKEWDWSYISEFATFLNRDTDSRVLELNDRLDFRVLSKREDTTLTLACIKKLSFHSWDWASLSSNETIAITLEFMLEFSDKPWDWRALSYRKNVTFDENTVELLSGKDIDWRYVSQRVDFIPSNASLKVLDDIDWQAVSHNQHFDILLIDPKYYDELDWYYLSSLDTFPIADKKFLISNSDRSLNWEYISGSRRLDIDLVTLKELGDYLDWDTINSRLSTNITNDMITLFADRLDWSNVSKSQEFEFTEELVGKYEDRWDWIELMRNPQIACNKELIGDKYKSKLNCVEFLSRFDVLSPKIYHFTHLYNAFNIIRNREILSRNMANGIFANAAGNLVNGRKTAHDYARFYFRPQTPTQFYNECLGMDSESGYMKEWKYWDGKNWKYESEWKSYYHKYEQLGLPKCPMPVFFEFDIKEILTKFSNNCYYSTGNMQTNWAQVKKVTDSPSDLNTSYLYSTIDDGVEIYKDYAQQEFLVDNVLDFNELKSFRIICFDDEQATILKDLLGDDKICRHITTNNNGIYHRNNRQLHIYDKDESIALSADYKGSACFKVRCDNVELLDVVNTDNITMSSNTVIEAYPTMEILKTNMPYEVYFVDKSFNMRREWLVYKNN